MSAPQATGTDTAPSQAGVVVQQIAEGAPPQQVQAAQAQPQPAAAAAQPAQVRDSPRPPLPPPAPPAPAAPPPRLPRRPRCRAAPRGSPLDLLATTAIQRC